MPDYTWRNLIPVSQGGGNYQLEEETEAFTEFDRTLHVAGWGSDSNDGFTRGTAKKTLGAVVSYLNGGPVTGAPDVGNRYGVFVHSTQRDAQLNEPGNTDQSFVTDLRVPEGVDIFAPHAWLVGWLEVGGDSVIYCYGIIGGTSTFTIRRHRFGGHPIGAARIHANVMKVGGGTNATFFETDNANVLEHDDLTVITTDMITLGSATSGLAPFGGTNGLCGRLTINAEQVFLTSTATHPLFKLTTGGHADGRISRLQPSSSAPEGLVTLVEMNNSAGGGAVGGEPSFSVHVGSGARAKSATWPSAPDPDDAGSAARLARLFNMSAGYCNITANELFVAGDSTQSGGVARLGFPETMSVKTFWVSTRGDDNWEGRTRNRPLRTVSEALSRINTLGGGGAVVSLETGTFNGETATAIPTSTFVLMPHATVLFSSTVTLNNGCTFRVGLGGIPASGNAFDLGASVGTVMPTIEVDGIFTFGTGAFLSATNSDDFCKLRVGRMLTSPAGYLLDVSAGTIDAEIFYYQNNTSGGGGLVKQSGGVVNLTVHSGEGDESTGITLDINGGECNVNANILDMAPATVWDVESGATLNITANKVSGTRLNNGTVRTQINDLV